MTKGVEPHPILLGAAVAVLVGAVPRTPATLAAAPAPAVQADLSLGPGALQSLPSPIVIVAGRALQTPDPDSAAAVRDAREAQGRFERRRLRHVDVEFGGGYGGSCDERLGRMCVWLREGRDWWPEEEDPELSSRREALLAELAAAAARAPGDEWILGQRVFYLGEAGRWREALALAGRCGGAPSWWCTALEGLAHHALGEYPAAEARFRVALASMPPETARAWTDPEPLLGGDGRDVWGDTPDDARERALHDLWRFSDPLHLVPGNDRWTEHMARRVVARTRDGARNPYALTWGSDLEELLVRYGWEIGWERHEPGAGSFTMSGSAVGHHHPYTRGFLALGEAWADPAASEPDDWNPGSRETPRTGYAPAYAPVFLPADAQVAVFPRGDSAVVLARAALPADTTWHGGHDHDPQPLPEALRGAEPRRGLFLIDADADTVRGTWEPGVEGGGLQVAVPAGRHLVSAEVWAPELRRAGRIRRGVEIRSAPPDVPTLSDLLLGAADGPEPRDLADAAASMLTAHRLHPGDSVRVVWEIHGLGWREETLGYALELRGDDGNVLERAGRFLGLVGDPSRVELEWTESGPESRGPHLRSVVLGLPGDLDPGPYTLRLEVASVGRSTLASERPVEVVPPPP